MEHKLPELGYKFDALEPFIDAKTMETHYTKHHQTYVDKLNAALASYKELQKRKVEDLLMDLDSLPQDIRTAVRNHGGGHFNHSFFWPLLKKDVKFSGPMKELIEKDFGSYDRFKQEFSDSAAKVFGSGWTWLVYNGSKLEIMNTPNQESPISIGKKPVLVLDVWEHAYYLKYQNKRPDYINAFFNVINWDRANENLKMIR